MLSVMENTLRQSQDKPYLASHDSLEECSLEHWHTVRQLVEQEFLYVEEFEVVRLETTVSCA